MQDENKTPVGEPQEVVGPVHPGRQPGGDGLLCASRPAACRRRTPYAPAAEKHSRKGLWIFLAVMAVLVMAAVAAALIAGPGGRRHCGRRP